MYPRSTRPSLYRVSWLLLFCVILFSSNSVVLGDGGAVKREAAAPTPTRTPTPTPTKTGTPSRSLSQTQTKTATKTASSTRSRSGTGTGTPSRSGTPSRTPTGTGTPSRTPTGTGTRTGTPSVTSTATPSTTPSIMMLPVDASHVLNASCYAMGTNYSMDFPPVSNVDQSSSRSGVVRVMRSYAAVLDMCVGICCANPGCTAWTFLPSTMLPTGEYGPGCVLRQGGTAEGLLASRVPVSTHGLASGVVIRPPSLSAIDSLAAAISAAAGMNGTNGSSSFVAPPPTLNSPLSRDACAADAIDLAALLNQTRIVMTQYDADLAFARQAYLDGSRALATVQSDIALAGTTIHSIHQRRISSESQLAKLQIQLDGLTQEWAIDSSDLDKMAQSIATASAERDRVQESVSRTQVVVSVLQSSVTASDATAASTTAKRKDLQKKVDALSALVLTATQANVKASSTLSLLLRSVIDARLKASQASEDADNAPATGHGALSTPSALRTSLDAALDSLSSVRAQMEAPKGALAIIKGKIAETQSAARDAGTALTKLQVQTTAQQRSFDDAAGMATKAASVLQLHKAAAADFIARANSLARAITALIARHDAAMGTLAELANATSSVLADKAAAQAEAASLAASEALGQAEIANFSAALSRLEANVTATTQNLSATTVSRMALERAISALQQGSKTVTRSTDLLATDLEADEELVAQLQQEEDTIVKRVHAIMLKIKARSETKATLASQLDFMRRRGDCDGDSDGVTDPTTSALSPCRAAELLSDEYAGVLDAIVNGRAPQVVQDMLDAFEGGGKARGATANSLNTSSPTTTSSAS